MATCGCGRKGSNMRPLYKDPHFTFRFKDDRIVPRFHLEGVQAGQRILVFSINPGTGRSVTCWRWRPWAKVAEWNCQCR
jgi:hypothetical protein